MRPLSVTAERRADGTIIKKGWHLMRDKKSHPYHSAVAPLAILVLVSASTFLACDHGSDAVTPEKIEQQYGVSGAHTDDVSTPEGAISGTVVPVTLADGRKAQLFIPQKRQNDPHGV